MLENNKVKSKRGRPPKVKVDLIVNSPSISLPKYYIEVGRVLSKKLIISFSNENLNIQQAKNIILDIFKHNEILEYVIRNNKSSSKFYAYTRLLNNFENRTAKGSCEIDNTLRVRCDSVLREKETVIKILEDIEDIKTYKSNVIITKELAFKIGVLHTKLILNELN